VLLEFEIGGTKAEFFRDSSTGRAELRHDGQVIGLASPYNPLTHVSLGTTQEWRRQVAGHEVEVVKVRARWAGGLRSHDFTVRVDGVVVAKASGD
jgi:hypothetical protein